MIKLVRIGYPGSRKVRKMSEYLIKKYTPFEILDIEYEGELTGWSNFVSNYLKTLEDKFIVFALDDYLISDRMWSILPRLQEGIVCAKLCQCSESENIEYPVTTQYTLWDREFLISLLDQTTTPWDFEMRGSQIFKKTNQKMQHWPVLKYYTNSSLSNRWEGIRLDGLNEEDKKEIEKL